MAKRIPAAASDCDGMIGVIYARYSSHSQREESIEDQLRECHEFAARNNIKIIAEYTDSALTGRTDSRPDFQKMIRDSARGKFQVVVTYKVDRFARDRYDSAIYKAKLRKNGVRVLYAKETIPDGPEGIILESVLEGYAEYYSAALSQNILRGLEGNAMKCKTNGVQVLGYYTGEDGCYEIDPDYASVVLSIFQKYDAGVPQKEIIDDLNARGFRTTRGFAFNKNSVTRILRNRKYIGEYSWGDVTVSGGMPQIVPLPLFDSVQRKLDRGSRAPAHKWKVADYILTSKLFCGHCGELMVGRAGTGKSGKKYDYYACVNRTRRHGCDKKPVKKEWIEDIVVKYTKEVVLAEDMIEQIADGVMDFLEREKKSNGELDALEASLKNVESSIRNMMQAIEQGIITKSTKQRLMELEEQRDQISAAIAREKIATPDIERDQIVYFLEKFKEGSLDDPDYRTKLVEAFVSSVYLWDDGRIVINYNYTGENNQLTLRQIEQELVDMDGAEGSPLDSSAPPEEEASNSSFTRTSLRLCIGWGTPDGVPFPFSLPRNAVFCVLRRCKPAGVLVYHSGFFRALKRLWSGLRDIRAPMCISRSLDARVAALRAAVGCGWTYRRGAAWAWPDIRPSVWPATTALRASVAFERYA